MNKLYDLIGGLNSFQKNKVIEYIEILDNPVGDLFEKISKLNRHQQNRVLEFMNALEKPCVEWINPESKYVDESFAEEFRSRILTQHAFQSTPLFQDTFDAAFIAGLNAGGKKCESAPPGERFWDLKAGNSKISLKSTKEKNLNLNKLKISKLTEAAWIQDCRTAAMREEYTKNLFTQYISTVSTIFQLRYFSKKSYYELIEIPISLFKPILEVPREYFNSDGPTIDIPVGANPPFMKLKIDRSDAKITINAILKSHCIVHGTWELL